MTSTRVRFGAVTNAAVAVLVLTTACDSERAAPMATPASGPATTTTVPTPPPVIRPVCEVSSPAAWQNAIAGSEVATGGVSTSPRAVARGGEVVAARDNGDTRDVLLIGTDKSVTEIYPVPDPNRNDVGFVAIDDRWIVIGVDRIPRGSNGVLPGLIRIDVIDRQNGSVRTVAQESEADYVAGLNTIDSFALFDGKVYWITRETYSGATGTIRSYDLGTGAVVDVESGAMRNVRATAAGLVWVAGEDPVPSTGDRWKRSEVKIAASLPPPVADALGTGLDWLSLTTDGTAYAWITGLARGGDGIAWWSPDSGLIRVTGDVVTMTRVLPPVYVTGPYVLISRSVDPTAPDVFATVVDSRSGAVTGLRYLSPGGSDFLDGANGGSIALNLLAPGDTAVTGVVRTDVLPPLAC